MIVDGFHLSLLATLNIAGSVKENKYSRFHFQRYMWLQQILSFYQDLTINVITIDLEDCTENNPADISEMSLHIV